MSSTERNLEMLMEDMRHVSRDVEALLKGIPKDLGDEGQKLRLRLEDSLDAARLRCRQIENRVERTVRDTAEWVHEKPYPVVGSAFGIGLLIGLLVGRHR